MSSIPPLIALPGIDTGTNLPIAIAVPVENDSNMRNACIRDYLQVPFLQRSTNHITMAPDDPDEWPYHYLKRELIELKKTIDVLELWTWLQIEIPPDDKGFMFWDHENMNLISDKLAELYENSHSGFSWGQSMRNIQTIALKGFDNWKQEIDTANGNRREK